MKKSPVDEIAVLRKELAKLTVEVAKLQKQQVRAAAKKSMKTGKLTVESLEVVSPTGEVVASIGSGGLVYCRTLKASKTRTTRGVFIDGVTFRSVSAGSLELIGISGNKPVVVANSWPSDGSITLKSTKSNAQLRLQADGGQLMGFSEKGRGAVTITSNGPSGGSIRLTGTMPNSKARATLGVSSRFEGELSLMNAQGKVTTKLP